MTGILVAKFKMGLIGVKDLAVMAAGESMMKRRLAAKNVLVCVRDDSDHSH